MAQPEELDEAHRTTAPQSAYTMRDVGVGFAIFVIGIALIVVLAFLV